MALSDKSHEILYEVEDVIEGRYVQKSPCYYKFLVSMQPNPAML